MIDIQPSQFSESEWLSSNGFEALAFIAQIVNEDEPRARECLIRMLEHRDSISEYSLALLGFKWLVAGQGRRSGSRWRS